MPTNIWGEFTQLGHSESGQFLADRHMEDGSYTEPSYDLIDLLLFQDVQTIDFVPVSHENCTDWFTYNDIPSADIQRYKTPCQDTFIFADTKTKDIQQYAAMVLSDLYTYLDVMYDYIPVPGSHLGFGGRVFLINALLNGVGLSGRISFIDYIEFKKQGFGGLIKFIETRLFPPVGVEPSYSLIEKPIFNNKLDTLGQNTQVGKVQNDVVWEYTLNFDNLEPSEYQLLINHFSSCLGKGKKFTFIHPDTGAQKVCRYALDTAQFELFIVTLYRWRKVVIRTLAQEEF